jgi:uncharacterized protein YegL
MKTIVNFILDKSGSMETCKDETIIGFNKYVQTLKKKAKKGTMQFSLTLFDTVITKPYIAVDISKVKPLNVETYNPNGWTALYDAAVDTIEAVSAKVDKMKEKTAVLTVIMTDGMENSSTKHNQDCLKDLVSKLKKEGNWTFVFLGANQDSWATGNLIGVDAGNVANFDTVNIKRAFVNLAGNTANYAASMMSVANTGSTMLNTKDFFEGKKDVSKDVA